MFYSVEEDNYVIWYNCYIQKGKKHKYFIYFIVRDELYVKIRNIIIQMFEDVISIIKILWITR